MLNIIKFAVLELKILAIKIKRTIKTFLSIPKAVWEISRSGTDQKEAKLGKLRREQKLLRRNIQYPKFFINSKIRKKNINVLPCYDAGFFYIFNNYVSHLVYAEENEIILPDWRLSNLLTEQTDLLAFNNFKLVSFCYGTEGDGNIFYRLFENPYPEIKSKIYETEKKDGSDKGEDVRKIQGSRVLG